MRCPRSDYSSVAAVSHYCDTVARAAWCDAMLRTPVLRLGRDSDYPDGRYSIVSYADAPCDGMRVVAPAMDDSSSSEGGNNATTTSTTVTPLDGSVTLPEAADAAAAAFLESSYTSW